MKSSTLPGSSRGSALAVAILFTMVCALLAFAVLQWSVTERRLNMRGALWLAARNAAEGVAEYGFSQVRNDFETSAAPGSYKPGSANALNLPNASVFAGSSVVTGALSSSNPNGMELIGGPWIQVPSGSSTYYVDPADYNNQFDPLKGKWVFRRDIVVLARATVMPPSGAPITHYMTETISVRGAPLFAYAIFYNGNLELSPGPQMDVYGPVHCNGSIFAAGENSGGLNFHGPVTCAGDIFHAWANANAAGQQDGGSAVAQTPVTFVNAAGNQVNMKASSANTSWKDSTMGASYGVSGGSPGDGTSANPPTGLFALVTPAVTTAFLQYAAATWGGNLQTSANGVLPYNPVSFNQVIDAAGDHPNPTVMIDPPSPPATSDPYYASKAAVESEKKSMQAGLYIKVAVPSSGTPTISIYGPPNSAPAGTPAANIGPNGGLLLNPPANVNNAPSSATPPLVSYLPFRRVKKVVTRTGSSGSYIYTTTYTVLNPDNTVDSTRAPLPTVSSSGSTGTTYAIYSDSSTGSYGYGLYDQRRGLATGSTTASTVNADGQIDLVQIDMTAVKGLVNSMINNTNDANALTYTDPVTNTTKVWNNANAVTSGLVSATQTPGAELTPWNGAIYIDVEAPNSGTSHQTTSVRLVNGTVANGSSLIPSVSSSSPGYGPNGIGLSIATNAPLYVLGHFNADGAYTSNSADTPDDGKDGSTGHVSKESPVSLASDAITILSPGWSDAGSLTLKPNASGDTEIAAAFLTGNVPTTSSAFSGGAHNLPRFLENWGSTIVAIRGSLVSMFSSRIASQPWSLNYYGAPDRKWGFDSIFKNGNFPPYSPKVMSYRRVDFTDLTAAQYAAKKAALWP